MRLSITMTAFVAAFALAACSKGPEGPAAAREPAGPQGAKGEQGFPGPQGGKSEKGGPGPQGP